MKRCPKCSRTYEDSQSFCLEDGMALINDSEDETIVRKKPAPAKGKILLWMGLALIIILGLGITFAGYVYYRIKNSNKNVVVKQQNNANVSPSPLTIATPKVAPTESAATASPSETAAPDTNIDNKATPTPENDVSDEITPIDWGTAASSFKGGDGQTYKFQCPPGGTEYIIWGSDIYTLDSSICTAAVHAGLFTFASGGTVTIEYKPGRQIYGSTTRNGVKSHTFGEYPHSYVVR